jgi:hypothetical protein
MFGMTKDSLPLARVGFITALTFSFNTALYFHPNKAGQSGHAEDKPNSDGKED